MILDSHCHLAAELGPAELIRVMDDGEVDRAVLVAEAVETLPPTPGEPLGFGPGFLASPLGLLGRLRYRLLVQDGRLKVGRAWYRTVAAPDNETVASAVRANPDRFIGFAFVNPLDPGHLDAVDRYLASGFRGVKVHAWFHRFSLTRGLGPVAERCGEHGVPMLLHLGGSRRTGLSVLELADRFPVTNFIVAHAGLPYYVPLWRAVRTHPNLYFDLAGPYMSADFLRVVARHVPPGRLLFASGSPYGLRTPDGGHSYARLKGWVRDLGLGKEAEKAVYGGNLARLAGLRFGARAA